MRRLIFVLLLGAFCRTAPAATPPLFARIRTGDVRAVKAAIATKADPDGLNEDGLTPLMYAVMTATPPVMRALLDAGANVNATNADGVAALHMAAFDLAKTRLLVERGAKVNAPYPGRRDGSDG